METKEQEAKEAWRNYWKNDSLLNGDLPEYLQGISDFQTAIIEALEKDKLEYTQKRDGWKEGSPNYETYDLAVRICNQHISLVKTVTPKKK
jgi:hypothetical protein